MVSALPGACETAGGSLERIQEVRLPPVPGRRQGVRVWKAGGDERCMLSPRRAARQLPGSTGFLPGLQRNRPARLQRPPHLAGL